MSHSYRAVCLSASPLGARFRLSIRWRGHELVPRHAVGRPARGHRRPGRRAPRARLGRGRRRPHGPLPPDAPDLRRRRPRRLRRHPPGRPPRRRRPRAWTAPTATAFTVALAGAQGSDWDLAVFDRATGRRLGGSGGFNADEVVTGDAAAGQQLDIQACRLGGAGSVPLDVATHPLPTRRGQAARGAEVHRDRPAVPRVARRRQRSGSTRSTTRTRAPSGDHPRPGRARPAEGRGLRVRGQDRRPARVRPRAGRADRALHRLLGRRASPLPSGRTEYRVYEDYHAELKKLADENPVDRPPGHAAEEVLPGPRAGRRRDLLRRQPHRRPEAGLVPHGHAPRPRVAVRRAHRSRWRSTSPRATAPTRRSPSCCATSRVVDRADHQPGRVRLLAHLALDRRPVGQPARRPGDDRVGRRRRVARLPAQELQRRRPARARRATSTAASTPTATTASAGAASARARCPTSQTYRGAGAVLRVRDAVGPRVLPDARRDVDALDAQRRLRSCCARRAAHRRPRARRGRLKALGDVMEADTGYTSQYGWQLYDTSGTTEDWNYGAAGTFGYTIEIGPSSTDGGHFHIALRRRRGRPVEARPATRAAACAARCCA